MNQNTKKRVLLVDDDASVRQALAGVLLSESYEVLEAKDGQEAVSLSASSPPDLVLLDLDMPGLDGWGTFAQINRRDPLLPVIVITALPNQSARAARLGLDALMEKPLDLPLLLKTIRQLLARKAAEGGAAFAQQTASAAQPRSLGSRQVLVGSKT